MTEAVITKIKNNAVTLPKTWKGARVFLRVSGNSATITKVRSSKTIFTDKEVAMLRTLGKKVSRATLRKALSQK
jgi:hypothetical protein